MATYDWPDELEVQGVEWAIQKAGLQFRSPYGGFTQAVELPGEQWMVSLTLPPRFAHEAGPAEAFLSNLAGGVNRTRLHHLMRPEPAGTMRGLPTSEAAAVGVKQLVIHTAPLATLASGDMIGVVDQLFQVFGHCTASASGVMTVPLVNRVRVAIGNGAAVVWDRPKAHFNMPAQAARYSYGKTILNTIAADLFEVWS